MKYCGSCGGKNWDTAQFCAKCGSKLETEIPPNNSTVNEQQKVEIQSNSVVPRHPRPDRTKSRPKWIYAAALSVIILGGSAYFIGHNLVSKPHYSFKPKVAIFNFETLGVNRDLGKIIAELLTTSLVETQNYDVVERGLLDNILTEQRIQISIVNPHEAARIGKMAGANIALIGSIMKIGSSFRIVLRLVDVETGVAREAKSITTDNEEDIPNKIEKVVSLIDIERLAVSSTQTASNIRTSSDSHKLAVMVVIPETVLQHPKPPDPAAETEIIRQFRNAGYKVVDQAKVSEIRNSQEIQQVIRGTLQPISQIGQTYDADIIIIGEAFAEQVQSLGGGMVTYRARVEARAIRSLDKSIIAAHGLHASGTDVTQIGAAKIALANAGQQLATYFLQEL